MRPVFTRIVEIFAFFGLAFLLATAAAALTLVMSPLLALRIMFAVVTAIAAMLGFLAVGAIKKGTPPVPEQAIREAKLTTDALKR